MLSQPSYRVILRLSFGVICCWLLLTGITGTSLAYGSANTEGTCIEYTDPQGNPGLLDLASGQTMVQTHPEEFSPQDNSFRIYRIPSPNAQYTVVIEPSGQQDNIWKLSIKHNTPQGKTVSLVDKIALDPLGYTNGNLDNSDDRDYRWSQDSQWLAFTWQSIEGIHYLSIVNAKTSSVHSAAIEANDNQIVNLFGWSGDQKYLAVAAWDQSTQDQQIMIWSVTDNKFIKHISLKNDIEQRQFGGGDDGFIYGPDFIQWSPTKNVLVYLSTHEETFTFHALSLDSNQEISQNIPETSIHEWDTPLVWSPDGTMLVVSTHSKVAAIEGTLLQLYLFNLLNLPSTKLEKISDYVPTMQFDFVMILTQPIAFWSLDSKTLFYGYKDPAIYHSTDYTDDYERYGAALMAFDPSTHKSDLLKSLVNFQPRETNNGTMFGTWLYNAKRYVAFEDHHAVDYSQDVELPQTVDDPNLSWTLGGNESGFTYATRGDVEVDISILHDLGFVGVKSGGNYVAGIIDGTLVVIDLEKDTTIKIALPDDLRQSSLLSVFARQKYIVLLSPALGKDQQTVTLMGLDGHVVRQFSISAHRNEPHWIVDMSNLPPSNNTALNPYNGMVRDLSPFRESNIQMLMLADNMLVNVIDQDFVVMNLDTGVTNTFPLSLPDPAILGVYPKGRYAAIASSSTRQDYKKVTFIGFDGRLIRQFEIKVYGFLFNGNIDCRWNP